MTIKPFAFLTVLIVAAGCSNDIPPTGLNHAFRPDDEARSIQHVYDAQVANGARDDATFDAAHFTGGKLNSLGTAKLDAIAYQGFAPVGTTAPKVTVYLNTPQADGVYLDRSEALKAYLESKGIALADVTITQGVNPASYAPAAHGVATLGAMSPVQAAPAAGAAAK